MKTETRARCRVTKKENITITELLKESEDKELMHLIYMILQKSR